MTNITSWTGLNAIRNGLSGQYQLMNNLTASDPDYIGIGDNWIPIGKTYPNWFGGSFNGNGFEIQNLTIYGSGDYIGLIGRATSTVVISNVKLINVNILGGSNYIGGLVGANYGGSITNCRSTGTVNCSSGYYVGGLVGLNSGGTVNKSYNSATVTGYMYVGGLVGRNPDTTSNIYNSYNTGNVSGNQYIGGLTGVNYGQIRNSYNTGNVSGSTNVGGLTSWNGNDASTVIANSYNTGIVTGTVKGGLIATNNYGTILNCGWFRHSTGAVKAINGTEFITYNIKDGGGEGYIDDTIDWFYDKTRGIYTIDTSGYGVWDFSVAMWYASTDAYPTLSPPFIEKADSITLSDEIELSVSLEKIILNDTLNLSDYSNFPEYIDGEIMELSDIVDLLRTKSKKETDSLSLLDEIEIRLPLEFIHNKTSFLLQTIKNINNKFSMLKGAVIDWTNKILFRGRGLYSLKNDFRMRASWQIAGDAGVQSLGKEFVKVYIATVEQTDVDVDSINITKSLNTSHTATFELGRAYDSTRPDLEAEVEIKYHMPLNGLPDPDKFWMLYKGYVTQITPADDPENITINCQDEYWKKNRTKVYFNVGHKPKDDTETYYSSIYTGLLACGMSFGIGIITPQVIGLQGTGKSDAISELVSQAGNFGWYYKTNGTPKLWTSGIGSIINIEEQEIGKNIGLYQLLKHTLKEDVEGLVNQYLVEIGKNVVKHTAGKYGIQAGAGAGVTADGTYKYQNFTFQPSPLWTSNMELHSEFSETGFGFDHPDPDNPYAKNVFVKYQLSNYTSFEQAFEKWQDVISPSVKLSPKGFGLYCSIPIGNPISTEGTFRATPQGEITDGFTIDYRSQTITFSQPVYYYKKNANGEIKYFERPNIHVTLYKKQLIQPSTKSPVPSPDNPIDKDTLDSLETENYPVRFYTAKMGNYPTTVIDFLSLSGLSSQQGFSYSTYQLRAYGSSLPYTQKTTYIPSWNDAPFALDMANWKLSNLCDVKVSGTIDITLDALCYYGIDLDNRIMINNILDKPVNIESITLSISSFTASLQLKTGRYYKRTVSIQSRGE